MTRSLVWVSTPVGSTALYILKSLVNTHGQSQWKDTWGELCGNAFPLNAAGWQPQGSEDERAFSLLFVRNNEAPRELKDHRALTTIQTQAVVVYSNQQKPIV